MAKVEMKETDYYKSGKHLENVLAAREKALLSTKKKKQERIDEYNLNPKICLCKDCDNPIPYEKSSTGNFCSRSCAGKYNNKKRRDSGYTRSEESRNKTSEALKGKKKDPDVIRNVTHSPVLLYCKICGCLFVKSYQSRHVKTCGNRKCVTMASTGQRSYQNGSRKPVYYFNKWQDKEVLLDSSWEVRIAKLLDELNIEWHRPDPIDWVDEKLVERMYFPDFYLPLYNLSPSIKPYDL